MAMPDKDRKIVRDLAAQVAAIAADPIQQQTIDLWKRHNAMQKTRPPMLLYDGTGHETGNRYPLQCTDDFARGQEAGLRGQIYHWEHMRDDHVWRAKIECDIKIDCTPMGLSEKSTRPDHQFGSRQFHEALHDDADPSSIPDPVVTVDWETTNRRFEQLSELYDGILEVYKNGVWVHWFAPLDLFITVRGIEQLMLDMIDRPEWVHGWLRRFADWEISRLKQCEKLGVMTLNNDARFVGSGGEGWTDELPLKDFNGTVRMKDQWGHAAAQIFSEVSPAMHEEFALQYEAPFLNLFGLKCYGCCEPLHHKVDVILKHVPDLRRLSMSPRADAFRGAAALGGRAIFSYKPNPADMSMEHWDVGILRARLKKVLDCCYANGCIPEVVMKDLHTVRGDVKRMWDWVAMARELSAQYA
ncbi:MAG: hypothetical protein ABFD85_11525 [Phycisphaerae bacterium]